MKRVLITGTNSGIGLQLARDYHRDGWQLVACGRNREKLEQALEGIDCELCVFDMLQPEPMQQAVSELSPLDLVILNAGNCEYIDDASQFDAELFARVVNANLIGTANCLAAMIPQIKQGGRVAVVSSSVTFLPLTRAEAYGASKAGLDYLTRTLGIDLAPHHIEVSLIRPGFVDTPLTRKNDFPMPGRVSPEQASAAIRKGLAKGKSEINFPFGFIMVLRLLSWLPHRLWAALARRTARSDK
ncbi:SDR family NAD(P)-dependent oxidoreductase [Oceanisphaera arctica]|uniref:Short-chain dehydrogenase n=1 Tax=Oceanisphaera arctica TaxID=641510 RepID=A0A2P5TRP2_9GAMM|nr:SDR family NAD(P)-dependent oxidoreductase [Oceanisphaera arctica]PPL18498.1 short-chain dehydrogenase [Oceanisphaera arctica]GHA16891.1 short-chain dehydrogenase [Oceanisphaera arctica]